MALAAESLENEMKKKDGPPRGSELWGAHIRKRAKALARKEDESKLALAETLYMVATTPVDGFKENPPIYTSWGYSSFYEWVAVELGLHRKKAKSLFNIWDTIMKLELEGSLKKRFIGVGWSKTRELCRVEKVGEDGVIPVMTKSNALDWIEMAENTNYPDLCVNIRRALEIAKQKAAIEGADEAPEVTPPEDSEKMQHFACPLYPEQKLNVELALKRAAELASSPAHKKCHHLDLICTDFLATNDFKFAGDPEMRWKMLAKYEELFGIRLIAVDPVKKKIVYGYDALELLATGGDDE